MTFQLTTGTVKRKVDCKTVRIFAYNQVSARKKPTVLQSKRKGVTFAWKDQFANYFNMSVHVL